MASRTELVYRSARLLSPPSSLARRTRNLWEKGRAAGPIMAALYLLCHYWIKLLDWISPVKNTKVP